MSNTERVVVGTLVALVALVAVGLLFLGPVGWLLAAAVVVATIVLADFSGLFEDETRPRQCNCGQCGAPNPVDSDSCGHCGAALASE
ncbi:MULTISPECIES: zinc ribbon domain-containing protein [Haloarcula]|uniref:zinc ribbon domain-containing protein n=1 Tax=Haloarcula TaxID=2237 RepID=UPI0023EDC3CC|nr:zinc ribbon domain-containing protein [Halomicroarcula sp. XH51]